MHQQMFFLALLSFRGASPRHELGSTGKQIPSSEATGKASYGLIRHYSTRPNNRSGKQGREARAACYRRTRESLHVPPAAEPSYFEITYQEVDKTNHLTAESAGHRDRWLRRLRWCYGAARHAAQQLGKEADWRSRCESRGRSRSPHGRRSM